MTNNEIERIFNTLFSTENADIQNTNVWYVDAEDKLFNNELMLCKRK